MKEINIAQVLTNKRKEKNITQDELAGYIGVSKASVSKWETGQSYPDITLLPRLAAYFNISIDELIDYKPQMLKSDIHKLYRRLASDFAAKPFEGVMKECRQIIKKYYSCFDLLMQMGALLLNHSMLAGSPEESAFIIEEAKQLFIRVKNESNDVELSKMALHLQAACCMSLGDADTVLDLLDEQSNPAINGESLLASAYQMKGMNRQAKQTLQGGIYQHIVSLFDVFSLYLMLCEGERERFEEALGRITAIEETFKIDRLHPAILIKVYLATAQNYAAAGNDEKALEWLEKYAQLVTSDIYPLRLHGDDFFDLLDDWLKEVDLTDHLPRDEKTIKESMIQAVTINPAFSALSGKSRYKRMTEQMKNKLKEAE
jgi:transcriptional regulator with XRE-family HTH domain